MLRLKDHMDFINKLNGKEYNFGIGSIKIADQKTFENFQLGYRSDGKEKDNLISDNAWKLNWYVIGRDGMLGDPCIINTENNSIYTFAHDGDYSDITKLASSIDNFIAILEITDSNLGNINNLNKKEKIKFISKTISEIEKIDPTTDLDYYRSTFSIYLYVE